MTATPTIGSSRVIAMPKPFAQNAPGPFYVEDGLCIACAAPESEAPDLMDHVGPNEPNAYHCFFKRQPQSVEETDRAMIAMQVCCCGALRYGGDDPTVVQRLLNLGIEHDQIDAV